MTDAFICGGLRTPFGRYGGALAQVRPDDLAAHCLSAVMARAPDLPPEAVDEVILGCTNQAGEDNRNVARMATLLAGLPDSVPGVTLNRLCGSGLEAVAAAARSIKTGEAEVVLAGGVESMSRAPLVMPKADRAFSRKTEIHDTTLGWRFVNPTMAARYGVESMAETAENLAADYQISRADQDAFALRSQHRAAQAQSSGRLAQEITPVTVEKGATFERDEHPRETTLEALAQLPAPFREGGSVTAGNASGVNDGAAVLLITSEAAAKRHDLTPLVRIVGTATAGVPPRIMGIGPVPASRKLLARCNVSLADLSVIELNEAFAAQALAVLRDLGLPEDGAHINPNGGAIALGHPVGASGARLALTTALELKAKGGHYGLCTLCVGVGQGIATLLEAV